MPCKKLDTVGVLRTYAASAVKLGTYINSLYEDATTDVTVDLTTLNNFIGQTGSNTITDQPLAIGFYRNEHTLPYWDEFTPVTDSGKVCDEITNVIAAGLLLLYSSDYVLLDEEADNLEDLLKFNTEWDALPEVTTSTSTTPAPTTSTPTTSTATETTVTVATPVAKSNKKWKIAGAVVGGLAIISIGFLIVKKLRK